MKPDNEAERLAALQSYDILDTEPELGFDDLTQLAADLLEVPTALVSLVDADRQWFKSRVGLAVSETDRDIAFCSHAIMNPDDPFVIPDAQVDPRFADNPLVTAAPNIRFYAGIPLVTPNELALGTLCVIDYEPRTLSERQINVLRTLARHVQSQLELRKTCTSLESLSGDLQVANEDLLHKSQEVQTFYHSVSHELKTPLTSAREFVSIILDGIAGSVNNEQREYLEIARDGLDQVVYSVHDLLDSTRLETGKMNLSREAVSAQDLVRRSVRMMKGRAEEKNIELIQQLPKADFELYVDCRRLIQVLSNLLSNAIKFTPEGGRVTLSLSRQVADEQSEAAVTKPASHGAQFAVTDTGCGIAEEHQARVFDRLYQAGRTDNHETGGLGLGLHICRGIVEQHDGTITLESTPGQGSTFRFVLPIESTRNQTSALVEEGA